MPIPELPFDVFVNILSHVPSDDLGTRTLVTCLTVNRLLNSAASTSALWEGRYHQRYLHSVKVKDEERIASYSHDYRLLYAARVKQDRDAISLLNDLIHAETNNERALYVNKLADLQWDVWDLMAHESSRRIPAAFAKVDELRGVDENQTIRPLPLTWRFWCQRVQQSIGSRYALKTWHELMGTDAPNTALCETSLNAISCYYSHSPFEVSVGTSISPSPGPEVERQLSRTLDGLADDCRVFIEAGNHKLDPEDASFDPAEICLRICEFMGSRGFAAVSDHNFRRTENSLPHLYLYGDNKRTIPLHLVHIFNAIGRRLGLSCYYVNYPSRLLACVKHHPAESQEVEIFVDVFDPRIVSEDEMLSVAQSVASDWPLFKQQILHSSNFDILSRATANILACSNSDRIALYFAQIPRTLRLPHIRTISYLLNYADDPVLEARTAVLPVFPVLWPERKNHLELLTKAYTEFEDGHPKSAKRREEQRNPIVHYVGTFFYHRKLHYIGLIRGWDARCEAEETWQITMGVDSLPRGRTQPFYNTLHLEGSERYVAEENIEPCSVSPDIVAQFVRNHSALGRHFSDVRLAGDGQASHLVPSPELQVEYPDDHVGPPAMEAELKIQP